MKATFTPPADFAEFMDRYPDFVERYLRGRWMFHHDDLEDKAREVSLYLMQLPEDSVCRERRCQDRIGTFDPLQYRVCDEKAFLGFVSVLIDNFLTQQRNLHKNRLIASASPLRSHSGKSLGDEAQKRRSRSLPARVDFSIRRTTA